ncbi:MAG: hypothetical protein Q8L48_19615 [Archangium sp.]|nr:hypothetical protein [Archangium sp.]
MIALTLLVLAAGCEKDTDCKGDRICEAGSCVSPGARPPAPDADAGVVVPPAAGGRAPLRAGDGEVVPKPVAPPGPPPAPPEPVSRVVGLLGVTAGLLTSGDFLSGAVGATGSVGVRFRSGVGLVGVGLIDYAPLAQSNVQLYGAGPGVRFGNRNQLTLATLPTLAVATVKVARTTVTGAAFAFTFLAQGSVVLIDILALFAQATLGVDTGGGVTFALSGGVGLSF